MTRKVVVTSNCQTAGIAASLQEIFPRDCVVPMPSRFPNAAIADAGPGLWQHLADADFWVVLPRLYENLRSRREFAAANPRLRAILIPNIRFGAFHPDLTRCRQIANGELVTPHYTSAIAVWAFLKRLDPADAANLFSRPIFHALGYLDAWEPSVEFLRAEFEQCALPFAEFLLSVKRHGLFMHSHNHPKALTLVRLAKLVAMQLGAPRSILEKPVEISDGLAHVTWPVYPEIGENLGVPAAYEWKVGGVHIGPRAYVDFVYRNFTSQGLTGDNMTVAFDRALFDRVLGAHMGVPT